MSESFQGLARLAQVSMRVHDLPRAEAFYRDTLGMKHLFSVPPKMAFFDCAGTRLYLAVPEQPEFDHPGSVLYFAVADIQAAHAALVERGVVFEEAPHLIARLPHADLWLAAFRDSEGNHLALQSEVPRG